jgi:hypothetical protein
LRQDAQARGDWEGVRELDFLFASVKRDQKVLSHLYFGTPYASYRNQVAADLKKIPSHYDWLLGSDKLRGANVLDIESGSFAGAQLKSGQLLLFRTQYFNPVSAPAVVHQALKRLRTWLDRHQVPLRIAENQGYYSLFGTAPMILRKTRGCLEESHTPERGVLREIKKVFGHSHFSSQEMAHSTGFSQRVSQYNIKRLLEKKLIEKISGGPHTTYRLVS